MTLSVDTHATRDFLFKSVAWSCAFALTLLVVDCKERLEFLLKFLVICGTFQAVYCSVMVLSGLEYGFLIKKTSNLGVATGTFVNCNHLASLVVMDVLIVGTWFGVDQVAERIRSTEVTSNADNILPAEDRDEVNAAALPYIKDYWLTGSGGGTFYVAFPQYHTPRMLGLYDFAHDDYVQMAAETGLVGLALCGSIVLGAIWQAVAAMRRRRDPLMRGTAFGVAMALSWLLFHSAVDFNMQMPANALTATVMLALAWVAAALPSSRQRRD